MRAIPLFLTAIALGGLGGALGSIVGNAFGRAGLWAGGVLGGLLMSLVTARIAVWRNWVPRTSFGPVALGTSLGFVAAAGVAVNTLSTPLGPIGSTLLIGIGALLGARFRAAHEGGAEVTRA